MTTVLVVDDSSLDVRMMGGLIRTRTDSEVVCARSGGAALAVLESEHIDLVVTDITMPEMDGFELLLAIKEKWPHIPVVLKTSKGNEELAVKALQQGAASYVPFYRVTEALAKTVEEVLATSVDDQLHTEFLSEMTSISFTFSLSTDLSSSENLVNYLLEPLHYFQLCDVLVRQRIGIALMEALKNAFEWGNMELNSNFAKFNQELFYEQLNARCSESPYKDRRIFIEAAISPDEARYVIRDEGPGFNHVHFPDPRDPEVVLKASGRGSVLMRTFMDDVVYNDVGNEVTLVKRRVANLS